MPSAPANHDPALTQTPANPSPTASSATAPSPSANIGAVSGDPNLIANLDSTQIMSLLRSLPNVFNKLTESGNLKEDAAQTLSNLSQAGFTAQHQMNVQHPFPGSNLPHHLHHQHPVMNDPGPSSHPRGPPNLGQLAAVGMDGQVPMPSTRSQGPSQPQPGQEMEEGPSDGDDGNQSGGGNVGGGAPTTPSTGGGRTRGNRSATMGSDEWSRQRKDNHKEVERRRRGNINEGINELGRIVPNGSGEKAKGAILSRAVQYIHHLKENEARNIEKWTLEKLLMDQAMGDLQAQLEEVRRLWEEERLARQRAESELEVLRGIHTANGRTNANRSKSPEDLVKRRAETSEGGQKDDGDERSSKRQRAE